ncbi:MAG TPA: polyprenyl synthetase family protein [Myxococcaceae bacterium]|nr:polyprenyl synthetase family protein [Myxococcaceae bacterium]
MALALTEPSDAALLWLRHVQSHVEGRLAELLALSDEQSIDPRWSEALAHTREYALRPAKRLRPALVAVGHGMGTGHAELPEGLWSFAAAFELLHTFLLIHDDVADCAERRRGSPALHRVLADGRLGEDLAVVMGDHLFARSIEAMLETGLPGTSRAVRYYLGVCRQTAAGQYLDLDLTRAPLPEVTLFQTLRVAHLKTARYGFVAPLVCGAMLAGAPRGLVDALDRVGRHVGLAYQMRDDVIGLFGDSQAAGKSTDGDFVQGKRTFPVVAAYTRAPHAIRAEMEALWAERRSDPVALARARTLVTAHGGLAATERLIERATRSARRALGSLPHGGGFRDLLDSLVLTLSQRRS